MQLRADTPAVDLDLREPFYTPNEVAEFAKVSSTTVLNWIKSGHLASVRLSERVIRIPRRSVLRLLASERLTAPKRVRLSDIPLHPD